MFFNFLKFYDAGAAEPAASESIAAIMAKSGRVVQPGDEPITGSTNKPEPAKTSQPAAQGTDASSTQALPADGKPANPGQPSEGQPAAKPQTEEPLKVPTWQEIIKSQQPDTIFKELGYDDKVLKLLNGRKSIDEKVLNFLSYYESGGDVKPYFEALTMDYSKLSAEEVMRRQLQKDTAGLNLTADQFNRLYTTKVVNRYKLDPQIFTEQEVADGQIELMADALPYRNAMIKEQQDYLIPKAPEKTPFDPMAERQQQEAQNLQEYTGLMNADPYYKEVLTNKEIVIGKGDNAFKFPVSEDQLKVLFDTKLWGAKLFDQQTGAPLTRKQILLAAIVNDDEGFFNAYEQHLLSKGGDKAVAAIKNASEQKGDEGAKADKTPASPAAAMAKGGRVVYGGQ